MLPGFIPTIITPSVSVEYITTVSDTVDRTTYTYTGTSIGEADTLRYIVLVMTGGATTVRTISSFTLGGNAMTLVFSQDTASANIAPSVWAISVPTGTTADISVTFSTSGTVQNAISVYRVLGLYSTTATATASDSGNSPMTGTVAVATNGIVFAGARNTSGGGTPYSLSNVIQDYTANLEGNAHAHGHAVNLPLISGYTVDATGANAGRFALASMR